MMKCQGLVVIVGGLPGDRELTFGSDGLLLIGVVFFPTSSLIGLCYSLATSDDGAVLGNVSGGGGILKKKLLVPLSPFFPLSSSLLSLSPLPSPFPSSFPFFFLSRSHSLFFSFPLIFLRFFFLRELLVLFTPEM